MTEKYAVSQSVINFGTIGVAGTFLGMPFNAMIFGAIGGAILNGLKPPNTRKEGTIRLLTSLLIAGTCTNVLATLIERYASLDADVVYNAVAFTLGAGWCFLLPFVISLFTTFINFISAKIGGEK